MQVHFTKMQGVGNDFIVVDARSGPSVDWPALAERLCRRRFGIGADGILVIEDAAGADAAMRMFNPDGTEDFCGNGLRCVARYVADARGKTQGESATSLTLSTIAGQRRAEVHANGSVTVEMGEPRFAPGEVPYDSAYATLDPNDLSLLTIVVRGETLQLFSLSTGTTHSILFVDEMPEDEQFFCLSPKIERHPLFPERTSVMWTKVEEPGRLRMRIWERGAGETWGCGSGACAAAVAARVRGYTGDETVVASKGGELSIRWSGSGLIFMTGPAEYVYRGEVDLEI